MLIEIIRLIEMSIRLHCFAIRIRANLYTKVNILGTNEQKGEKKAIKKGSENAIKH